VFERGEASLQSEETLNRVKFKPTAVQTVQRFGRQLSHLYLDTIKKR
jgi:hypothetical protein